MKKYLPISIMLILFAILFAELPAYAVNSPRFMIATRQGNTLHLVWLMNNPDQEPTHFVLYEKVGNNDSIPYTAVRTYQTEDLRDDGLITGDTVETNYIREGGYQQGVYRYYLKAFINDQASERSDIKAIEVGNNQQSVRFTSEPITIVQIDNVYRYDANAVSSDGSDLIYSIINGPDNMEINENTGVIEWDPVEIGEYPVVIRAALADDNNVRAQQSFTIRVVNCTQVGRIYITVVNQNGEPMNGVATLFRGTNSDSAGQVRNYSFQAGNVFFGELIEGTYFVRVQYPINNNQTRHRWYENALERADATPIVVECGDTIRLEMVIEVELPFGQIDITSEPVETGRIGFDYIYDVDAEATPDSLNELITYILLVSPDAMIINETTGEISWTPTRAGTFRCAVEARIVRGDEIIRDVQEWTIRITECDVPPIIIGTIVDEEGAPIQFGQIQLLRVDVDSMNSGSRNVQFQGGTFFIGEITPGSYKIKAKSQENLFESEWWENVYEMAEAQILNIECGDTLYIDFVVTRVNNQRFAVSGYVREYETNMAIENARVTFFGFSPNSNEVTTTVVFSNDNGYYVVELPANRDYIAHCTKFDSLENRYTYVPQFYELTENISEATLIDLQENMDGINFQLLEMPEYENMFIGSVENNQGVRIPNCNVIAILVYPENEDWNLLLNSRSTTTNGDGLFTFENLIPGQYIFFAMPMERIFFPGYYRENNIAARFWRDATRVAIDADDQIDGIDIILPIREIRNGNREFRGRLRHNNGRIKIGDTPLSALPVNGAYSYAVNEAEITESYAKSNHLGDVSVKELNPGKYTIFVDKVGFETATIQIEIGESDQFIDADLSMNPQDVSPVYEGQVLLNPSIFPNPANNYINIFYHASNVLTDVTIINTSGNVVMNIKLNSVIGMNNNHLDVSNLSNGMYFVKISNAIGNYMVPFSINR